MVLQTTAGWRKAPALAQRVCTRGLASRSSISLKNTMNTKDLEWFGPPERNTLRPLCVVLPSLEREGVRESSSVSEERLCLCLCGEDCRAQRAPPSYISREARTQLLGPRQVGPTLQYKITYCSYIMASQAKEISLLDSLACSRSPSSIMS